MRAEFCALSPARLPSGGSAQNLGERILLYFIHWNVFRYRNTNKRPNAVLHIIGWCLLIAAFISLACAFRAPSIRSKTQVRKMPMFVMIFLITGLGGITLLLGTRMIKSSVSVYGTAADQNDYQTLVSALGGEYVFNTLDTYAKRPGGAEAQSCSAEQLHVFLERVKERTNLNFTQIVLPKCRSGNGLTNFLHPHIAVYLR